VQSREDVSIESTTSILSPVSYINYEDVTLIWADSNANETDDCLHTQNYLRTFVKDIEIFDNAVNTIEYIQWIAPGKKIFLIISGLLAESVLSQTHNDSQLKAVYIFCLNEEKHTLLMNQYAKIRGIFLDKFKLFRQMMEDVLQFDEKAFSMHIFAQKHAGGTEISMRDYIFDDKITPNWVELFCFVLLYLPLDRKQAKQDMLTECRKYYRGNEAEAKKIDEFERQNGTENVIHWYTRDSFVYRLINKALRTLNIDIIFKFRFFIIELYRQLKFYHTDYIQSLLFNPTCARKIDTVYRGQLMSSDELEKLKNNVGEIISTSSFLSTTEDKKMAEIFIDGAPFSESALFEINIPDSYYEQIGDSLSYTRPFFKVDSLSHFTGENEIIFSIGTVFRIRSVKEDSHWRICLELDEHNNVFMQFFRYFEKKEHQYPHDWQTRTTVEERILLLTEKLPKSYRAIVNFYIKEGVIIDAKQHPTTATESMNYYRKGFDLLCTCLPDHFYLLRVIMCLSMSFFYNNLGDIDKSIHLGELALDIVKDYLLADSDCLLACYNYLAVIYKLDNRLEGIFSIYGDMFHIARKHKNTSALFEICDKLCNLSHRFGCHTRVSQYQKTMFKCFLRIFMRKIPYLPDHNHILYLKYQTLIKFLQRLIKCKWSRKRKRSLEVLAAKRWLTCSPFTSYIDKLKFMLYFELNDLPRFQLSLNSLLTQAIIQLEPHQIYESSFQQLRQDVKRMFSIVPACLSKIETNVQILKNFLQSLDAYERSLHLIERKYGPTQLMKRNRDLGLEATLSKIKPVVRNFIRYSHKILNQKQQRPKLRPRHRSSPIYLHWSEYPRAHTSLAMRF
jgi:hypothetical protein